MATSLQWNFKPSRDYGGDWRAYFTEYTSVLRDIKKDREAEVESKVLISRERVTIDELPSKIQAYAKLLPAGVFHAMHSQTWHEGAVFKTGARAGEKRPDKTIDHYAIGHEGKNPLTAVWSGGTLQYAKGVLNGELRWTEKATELGAWLKGEWE